MKSYSDLVLFVTGVRICEKVRVESIATVNGRVSGVHTDKGNIKCDIFVNCGGLVRSSRITEVLSNMHEVIRANRNGGSCCHRVVITAGIPQSPIELIQDKRLLVQQAAGV